jgi:alpha-tubulin suppressor-like RCC1 family protein
MNLLLIDNRVQDYETIVAAIDPALAVGVVFDYYEDTFDTVKTRMRELGLTNGTTQISVGLIQHNYNAPMFTMFASADVSPVAQVAAQDPDLTAWTQFRDFIAWCNTEFNAAYFDMMACALYSDPDWKYVIDTLTAQTGVTVRASNDDTGAASLGGDWFLESHTGISLKTVYFTEAIEEYRGIFANQGEYFTVIITTTGLIYAAGRNLYGQLGVGDTNNRTTFTLMPLPTNKTPKMHACGSDHTIVLMTDGTLYGTGYNAQGQLGVGDTTNRSTLTQISIPEGKVIKSIACGRLYTNVLMTDGTVYGTGSTPGAITFFYSPGGQGFGNKSTLTALEFPDGPARNVKKIACGGAHTVFITNNGSLFGVGDNSSRQLGGIWTGPNYYMTPNYYWDYDRTSTKPITNSSGKTPANVICGNFNTIIVMTDGTRYGLGKSSGLGVTSNDANEISLVLNSVNTVADVISSGTDYSMLLMTNGLIYGTGSNQYGRLGININNSTVYSSMVQMVNATGKTPKSVACGSFHTIVLMTDGTIYGIGVNWFGQLGISNSDPIQITILPVPGDALVASIGQPLVVTTVLSTFTVPTSKKFGDASFNITAPLPTSASSEIVTYISNNPNVATIDSSGVIRIIGVGDVSFNALQSATEDYTSATVTSNTLTVSLGTPTLSTFSVATSKTFGDASFNIIAPLPTSASSGAITYTSNNTSVATIDVSGNWITIVGSGDVTFTAYQADVSGQYTEATIESNTLTVSRATPTLSGSSFEVPSSKTFGNAPFSFDTLPTSNNTSVAIVYSSSNTNVATVDASGTTITIVGVGDVSFNAIQPQTNQYNAATKTSNTLTVSKGTPTLAFVSPPTTKILTDDAFTVVASSASSGAVTYTSSNTDRATVGLTTGLVTLLDTGSVTITAAQAATSQYNAPTNTTFTMTIGAPTNLAGTVITTSLARKNLTGVSLVGTNLTNISLANTNLRNADLSGAVVTGASFINTDISGATNLPVFSTKQKLQLMRNSNNAAISAVQISTSLSGAEINAAITTPIPDISGATFVVKAPAYNVNNEKVVVVTAEDMANNESLYIPMNSGETVKVNGVAYTFDGTNILNSSGSVIQFINVLGKPFRLYAGSIVGLNVADQLNNIKLNGDGLYDILTGLFAAKT